MFRSNRGPRSPEGKPAVIRARLKHGLAASNIVLPIVHNFRRQPSGAPKKMLL